MNTKIFSWLLMAVLAGTTVLTAGAAADPPATVLQQTRGSVIFHGRYRHWNTGREIPQPSEVWLKQTEDGALVAIAEVPFMNSCEIAGGDLTGGFRSYQILTRSVGDRAGGEVTYKFQEGKVLATRRGIRQDWNGKEFAVPFGALFDPNTRPDAYCAANILIRAFLTVGTEPKQFRVFDVDNSGDGFADYVIQVENVGKERTEVPAGTFEANHLVLTQKTSADTWYKKRAGHITDFWVLDNCVIVRIRRQREPYEVMLLDFVVPKTLPGHVSFPSPAIVAEPSPASIYAEDWAAFVREVDQSYPFFELKSIRRDWLASKPGLSNLVQACQSDADFLAVVNQTIRCLRDSHMGLSQTRVQPASPGPCYFPGVSFMAATQGRVVVMSAEANTETLKPGTIIAKIDGRPARGVLDEKAMEAWSVSSPYPLSFSSPQRARLFAYRLPLLTAQTNQTHTLTYFKDGSEQELRVECNFEVRGWPHTYNLPHNLVRAGRNLSYALRPSGAGYIYLRSVGRDAADSLRTAVTALNSARGWIIDLRGNGGGGYDTNLVAQLKAIPRPVVTLIDAGCISAGETLARDLAQFAGAHLMGAPTAGASSAKRQWQFPSGIASVTFSTRSRWRNDGRPIEFNGITPDESIEPAPEEVVQGQNSEILRAEEYLRSTMASPSDPGGGIPRATQP